MHPLKTVQVRENPELFGLKEFYEQSHVTDGKWLPIIFENWHISQSKRSHAKAK